MIKSLTKALQHLDLLEIKAHVVLSGENEIVSEKGFSTSREPSCDLQHVRQRSKCF